MAKMEIKNIDDAVYYYPRYFDRPADVLNENTLSRPNKIRLLKHWKQDMELEQVAVEENMPYSQTPSNLLEEIIEALHELGAYENTERTPPTKFGGI